MPYRYYLSNNINKAGEALILLSWSVHGIRLRTTIARSVNPKDWVNINGTFVKSAASLSDGTKGADLNAVLLSLSMHLTKYEHALPIGIKPKPTELKAQVNIGLGHSETVAHSTKDIFRDLREYINEGVNIKGWADHTWQKYETFFKHLKEHDEAISYAHFDRDGVNSYIVFLQDTKGMQDVSVKKDIKMLSAFLRWAGEKGYCSNKLFTNAVFNEKTTKKPVLYLDKDELVRLLFWDVPNDGQTVTVTDSSGDKTEITVEGHAPMCKVRDLFCFCSFTGLRFSDAMALKKTDVFGDRIVFTTIKTDDPLTVELIPQAKEILQRWPSRGDFALPHMTNQKANDYLKDLFRLFGLDQIVTTIRYSKGRRYETKQTKWSMMSTHAARRTFIVNALSLGIAPSIIMKWTGHSSYAAMKPYIDIADSAKADAMSLIGSAYEKASGKLSD